MIETFWFLEITVEIQANHNIYLQCTYILRLLPMIWTLEKRYLYGPTGLKQDQTKIKCHRNIFFPKKKVQLSKQPLPSTSSGSRDIFSLHFTVSLYASKKQTFAPRQVISIRVRDWASLSRPIQILIRRRNRLYAFPKMMSILDFKQKVLAVNNLFNTDHLSLASTPLSSRWTAPLK
jgi:hypothetical protein